MYTPKFDLKRFSRVDGLGIFVTLNGNNNLVLRNRDNSKYLKFILTKETATLFVEYLVDNGAGTTRGIGRIGDISKTGSSKLTYVMVTKDKDNPIPEDKDVYKNKRLLKPNEFVLYTLGSNIKITAKVTNDGNLDIELWNLPIDGVTLPTTVTDGFTNWLAYWFASPAVAMRFKSNRNKVTKFKGHHGISDIYLTKDVETGEYLLITVFNDKNPCKCLVFRYTITDMGPNWVEIYEYDMITENIRFMSKLQSTTNTPNEDIIKHINLNTTTFKDYNIKAKGDVEAFNNALIQWRYKNTRRCTALGGLDYYG